MFVFCVLRFFSLGFQPTPEMDGADDTDGQRRQRESTDNNEDLLLLETRNGDFDDANANFVSVGKEFGASQLQGMIFLLLFAYCSVKITFQL